MGIGYEVLGGFGDKFGGGSGRKGRQNCDKHYEYLPGGHRAAADGGPDKFPNIWNGHS